MAYVFFVMSKNGMDPTVMLAQGADASVQLDYAESRLGRSIVARPELGHDGKFFFIQANDPFLLDPENNAAFLDRPLYRSQRMLYPALASVFGLMPASAIVWGLIAVNVLAVVVGSAVTAELASVVGTNRLLGVSFLINPGVVAEVDIDGAGAIAFALGIAGLLCVVRKRFWAATALLSLAVLSRETMILMALGLLIGIWIYFRSWKAQILVVPALVAGLWRLLASSSLDAGGIDRIGGYAAYGAALDLPLRGFVQAIPYWGGSPIDLVFTIALLVFVVLGFTRAVLSPSLIGWSAIPFALLPIFISIHVWIEPFDIARTMIPIFTIYPLLAFSSSKATKRLAQYEMMAREI
jgi:hypothetical protein